MEERRYYSDGNITHGEEIVGSVTPLVLKPSTGQTYILKDKSKE